MDATGGEVDLVGGDWRVRAECQRCRGIRRGSRVVAAGLVVEGPQPRELGRRW